MKVLIDHPTPFALAHGGLQIQIEQTKAALESIGVDVDWVRWWDSSQTCDVLHYFGRPSTDYIRFANQRGIRVLVFDLLTGLGSRKPAALLAQRATIATLRRISLFGRMGWDVYGQADAVVVGTPWEAQLVRDIFAAPAAKVHVVPNGVELDFLNSQPVPRGEWLICTATITQRKRVVEVARAAVHAKVKLWVIGRPYAEDDPYYKEFLQVAKGSSEWVRYEGAIADRTRLATIYREARGFVLLSTMESLSLSAGEAAACECPLLLSDLPWARCTYGESARYCSVAASTETTGAALKQFYQDAPNRPRPATPPGWTAIAKMLQQIYGSLVVPLPSQSAGIR